MIRDKLMINASKTEFILIGTERLQSTPKLVGLI